MVKHRNTVDSEGAQLSSRSLERLSRLETLATVGGGELESVRVRHEHAF